jgi:ribA/ribD-fused uncharacterized protein
MSEIKFYSQRGPYGCFSNFSNHNVIIDGKNWKTTEHYYQAQKFARTHHEDDIRSLSTPKLAATAGRDRNKPLREDWELVKESIMYKALKAKFTQHEELKNTLLGTKDTKLIENSPVDYYWGCGSNNTGQNRLGILLMRLRSELKDA